MMNNEVLVLNHASNVDTANPKTFFFSSEEKQTSTHKYFTFFSFIKIAITGLKDPCVLMLYKAPLELLSCTEM